MASPAHDEAERRLLRLLEENDLPAPDAVEHREGEILALYHAQKVAVVVELARGEAADGDGAWP